ncbi:MAG: RNA polymerase sigma factor, partial [Gaiellaceae bacterium]
MTVSAIETIYRRQYQRFLAVAVGIVRDRDLAHDAVQETFARAIRGRDEIRSEAALPTWLWRVLTNICFAARDGAWSAI